ncbi:MAG: MBL fold metallo-hydrolase [Gammaproteobacteria bacterium]|jgi:ribonuclease Z|nr:MBL fold metallo-hydrolase [Gammaproteobacteria bacterium]
MGLHRSRRKLTFTVSLVAVFTAAMVALAAQSEALQDWAMLKLYAAVTVNPNVSSGPDSLSAAVCGSRSPIPDPQRAEACVLVSAGDRLFVVDVGDGSVARLRQWAIPFNKIERVFLTHLHSDHLSDLADLHLATWVLLDRPGKLPVYGPKGVEKITAGFEQAYEIDYGLRNAHHGDALAPLATAGFDAHAIDDAAPVLLEEDGLKITAFLVQHAPVVPAYGYRFDYKGRSLVISGDTTKSDELIRQSTDADVLFHEAQSNEMLALMRTASLASGQTKRAKLFEDITTYHSTPEEAAEVANEAGVGHLVYYHLTPPPRTWLMEKRLLRNAVKVRPKDWTLAVDGTQVTLPVGSADIILGSR